MFNVDLI
jgi:excisionase family DNA binding protein